MYALNKTLSCSSNKEFLEGQDFVCFFLKDTLVLPTTTRVCLATTKTKIKKPKPKPKYLYRKKTKSYKSIKERTTRNTMGNVFCTCVGMCVCLLF